MKMPPKNETVAPGIKKQAKHNELITPMASPMPTSTARMPPVKVMMPIAVNLPGFFPAFCSLGKRFVSSGSWHRGFHEAC